MPKSPASKNKRVPSKVLTKPKEADVPATPRDLKGRRDPRDPKDPKGPRDPTRPKDPKDTSMRPLTHSPSATQGGNGLVGSRASVKE